MKILPIYSSKFSFSILCLQHCRLVSGYTNKLNPGKSYYWNLYGKKIISKYGKNATPKSLTKGNDVTFSEFVQFVTDSGQQIDGHWRPQHLLSFPCYVNYTYIGKFETLHEDTTYLLQRIYGSKIIKEVESMKKKTNNTDIAKYFGEISPEYIEKIRELYKYDFLFFNYSTDIPH